ncbi:hypothetical protein D8M04_19490 [Oceanobacillus piezotolerans]|uniref:Uncharacterized protein n=1 Tax=Oceanobacillus piezotolerans TaxID=2448030 RepID=A0A498D164_9BACI|nr:hypothetical protein D8M04_19490 [Oceanobacillus piezotolerans]
MGFLDKWMERELAIFKNIVDTCNTEDRILLIIGSDHLWLLRELSEGNGWKVINPFLVNKVLVLFYKRVRLLNKQQSPFFIE